MVDNIQIVVTSNDNESSQVTLPGFSICVPVPVIRGLTRFLTMAAVAEVEDGVVIIDCVAIFYEEGEGGEHYRNKNKFRCRVSRIGKMPCKVKREKFVSLPLTGAACETVKIVDP